MLCGQCWRNIHSISRAHNKNDPTKFLTTNSRKCFHKVRMWRILARHCSNRISCVGQEAKSDNVHRTRKPVILKGLQDFDKIRSHHGATLISDATATADNPHFPILWNICVPSHSPNYYPLWLRFPCSGHSVYTIGRVRDICNIRRSSHSPCETSYPSSTFLPYPVALEGGTYTGW